MPKVEQIVLYNISKERKTEPFHTFLTETLTKETEGIECVTFGKTFTERHHGLFTHASVTRFRDTTTWEQYKKSHEPLIKKEHVIQDETKDLLEMVFETPDDDAATASLPEEETNHQKDDRKAIEHIVLLDFKPDVSEEILAKTKQETLKLKQQLNGIEFLTFGKALPTSNNQGKFTHALIVRLSDQKSFEEYGPSDVHQKLVKEHIAPHITGPPLAMDYFI